MRTPRDYFRPPPPKSFRKEMDNIFIIFLCTFSKGFVEFVVPLTKTFAPPLSQQEVIDAISVVFFITTYINDAQ